MYARLFSSRQHLCSKPRPLGTVCDDVDLTTNNDICDGAGACAGTWIECPELTICTPSYTQNGVNCTPQHATSGTVCDDTSNDTLNDLCDGSGSCIGIPYSCTPDQCDLSSTTNGVDCTIVRQPSGFACNDGDNDTQADVCDGDGGCAGSPYTCTPGQCDLSSTTNGVDCTIVRQPLGFLCDDGNPATGTDVCDGSGDCFGVNYECVPTQCQLSSTPNGVDCTIVNQPDGFACDDGNLTTNNDVCNGAGGCAGGGCASARRTRPPSGTAPRALR